MPKRPSVLAGPESATEHLRNALQLLNDAAEALAIQRSPGAHHVASSPEASIHAARQRVAAALTQLEFRPMTAHAP